uniref:Cytochrome P450 n=1 Tax=Glossina morsitans morsitans TaxID=37546 RepID=A0A1B0G7T9_GLOMM
MWIEFILLSCLIIYLFHRWATANNDFFLKRGIPHKKPKILFGNMWNLILKRKSIVDIIVDLYNEHDGPFMRSSFVNERLALLWPSQDVTYELKDGKKLEIKKDDVIWIPTAGLHRDSAYYENPEKFDPERFNEANNNNISPFTYLPFGMGPRNCIEFILLSCLIIYLLNRWATANNDFFLKRGIPYKKPKILFGNMWNLILKRKSIVDIIVDLYNEHDGPVYRFFDSRQPVLLIRDPDIIKQITVKDFNHFINHRALFNDENDQNNLFGSSLVTMRDSRWKDMRSTLSPAFTGNKMRQMFRLMNEVAVGAVAYLKQEQREDPTRAVEVDVTHFASPHVTATMIGPFDKKSTEYFMRLVIDAMKYRKENNIIRSDMINMLMEARGMISSDNPKPHNREWSDVDIVAQCFLFFFAGFDANASLACCMAHEIMENAEVQEKLLQEIRETHNNLNGEPVTYEVIQNMRYMDNVISETLRKWTPAAFMDRVCNQDVTYELKDGKKLEIKKDDVIWIPTAGLHRDSAYYENPEKFDPERFNEANNNNISPFTYLPFGMGPRNCIASRFALLETKVLIYCLLRDFQSAKAKKSCVPLKLIQTGLQLLPRNGFWLKFIARY